MVNGFGTPLPPASESIWLCSASIFSLIVMMLLSWPEVKSVMAAMGDGVLLGRLLVNHGNMGVEGQVCRTNDNRSLCATAVLMRNLQECKDRFSQTYVKTNVLEGWNSSTHPSDSGLPSHLSWTTENRRPKVAFDSHVCHATLQWPTVEEGVLAGDAQGNSQGLPGVWEQPKIQARPTDRIHHPVVHVKATRQFRG